MISLETLTRRYWALRPAFGTGVVGWRTCLRTVLLYLTLPVIIGCGSWIDGTLWMRGSGKGLLQHYGILTIFATAPVIVLLTALSMQKFLLAMKNLASYTELGIVPPDLERLVARHMRSLSLRTKSVWLFVLFCLIGLLFTVANIAQTINPVRTYGNDVYDAFRYPFGFYSTKLYFLLIWSFCYPAAVFVAVHLTLSLIRILRHMCRHDLLRIDFFHPDNCGGVSVFGSINLLVMMIYGNLFAVLYMLHITHSAKTYLTVTIPWIVLSGIFFAQSFGAVYNIHRFAAIKRDESLNAISHLLTDQMGSLFTERRFSADLIHARNHLLGLHTYPYAKPVLAIVNFIRFASVIPALLTVAKLLTP